MEPLTIFAAMIGFIGIYHVTDSVVKVLAKGKTTTRRNKSDNWYCFFKLPALLGKDWKPVEERRRETLQQNRPASRKRNQTDRRPRLYA